MRHFNLKKFALIVVALIAAAYAWLNIYPKYELHYRLTVETEVDGKAIKASGVIRILFAEPHCLLCNNNYAAVVKGEAIPLDLGDRGTAFVLLTRGKDPNSNPDSIVLHTFPDYFKYLKPGGMIPGVRGLSGKVNLPLTRLPMIVRFTDINDPKSVEEVDPEHMDKTFGPGVKITRASLEITKDPISTGIEKRFPLWFGEQTFKHVRLNGNSGAMFTNVLSDVLATVDFRQGLDPTTPIGDPWAPKK